MRYEVFRKGLGQRNREVTENDEDHSMVVGLFEEISKKMQRKKTSREKMSQTENK